MHRQLINPKLYLMILCDTALFASSYYIAYLLRFDFFIDPHFIRQFQMTLFWIIPLKVVIFFGLGLYRGMWRYTSVRDFGHLFQASVLSTLLIMAIILYVYRFQGYSRAVFLMDGVLTFLMTGGLRLLIRYHYTGGMHLNGWSPFHKKDGESHPILIIGAGNTGEKTLRELNENEQLDYHVIGFVDDDPEKQGRSIHGIPIIGKIDHLPYLASKWEVREALIAIPSASGDRMRRILKICKDCGIEYKTLPSMGEIIDGRVSIKKLRDVSYEDLLGRPPVQLDKQSISHYLEGRTILITGCGGSIGAELCRQVVPFQPQNLILFDASEENLFTVVDILLPYTTKNSEEGSGERGFA